MAKHDAKPTDANKPAQAGGLKSLFDLGGKGAALAAGALVAVLVPLVIYLAVPRLASPEEKKSEETVSLADAERAFDEGAYARARKLANQLRKADSAVDVAGATYVLGAATALEAEEYLGAERDELYLLAAAYLQEAEHLGFPAEHRAEGLFLLGKSLSMTGRYAQSRAPLEEALALFDEGSTMLHWLLALAYRQGDKPDMAKALGHITAYLEDEDLEPADRYAGLVEQARMNYELDDEEKCAACLAQVPREATEFYESELMRGRLAIRTAERMKATLDPAATAKDKQKVVAAFENAIKTFRRAQDDPLGSETIRRSMYLIGVCFLEMEDYSAALAQFERTRKMWMDTEEGMAAALEEADLLRRGGHFDDAMAAYDRVLASAKTPFENAWIPPEEFRGRVLSAYRQLIELAQFEQAVALADGLVPLFSPARAAEYGAEAVRAWSSKLLAEADALTEPDLVATRQRSRALMRKAGRLFANLAKIEFSTRQYPDDLWRSAEAFLEGHDYRSAVATFEEYLKHESRRRRARALINMGECYLALNRLDEALEVCQECIEFHPTDAASYQVRLVTSKVYLEKGDYAAAEAVLRENLNGDFLAPESKEWKESLFRLGELLQIKGNHEEAIQKLREAVERYPDTHEAVRAHYLIAESYRQLAKNIQDKLLVDTNETTRIAQLKELQLALNSSIQYFKQVQDALIRRQEKAKLTNLERLILRNSFFAEGGAWFELGRYDNAIRAYSTITSRYQHDPEALEAFVQIASCYRRMNKTTEARGTIQHAKVVLSRMDPDAPFAKVTNSTRREWMDFLEWLGTL